MSKLYLLLDFTVDSRTQRDALKAFDDPPDVVNDLLENWLIRHGIEAQLKITQIPDQIGEMLAKAAAEGGPLSNSLFDVNTTPESGAVN